MVKWIALVLVLVPVSAAAGFINKKTDWDKMDQLTKIGYVMGTFDYQMVTYSGNLQTSQYHDDVENCVSDLALTASDMVTIVDTGYQELEKWELPPTAVYLQGIRKVCLANINRARAARGEELLKP